MTATAAVFGRPRFTPSEVMITADLVQQRLDALTADVARPSSIGTIGAQEQHTEGLREAGLPARVDAVIEYPFASVHEVRM